MSLMKQVEVFTPKELNMCTTFFNKVLEEMNTTYKEAQAMIELLNTMTALSEKAKEAGIEGGIVINTTHKDVVEATTSDELSTYMTDKMVKVKADIEEMQIIVNKFNAIKEVIEPSEV
jgi:hypothetical protein